MNTKSANRFDHQNRRAFCGIVATASAAMLTGCVSPAQSKQGIIDGHTHFYDPTRPQGVPWPPKDDALLYRRVMPEDLKIIAQPLGVRGTVVVEASSWVEDNQWVLDLAAREPFILGLVGHLKPGQPGFANDLARFAANPLFCGIRTGLWGVTVSPQDSEFVRDLQRVASRNLSLDVIVGPDQLDRVAQLSDAVPDLRIVVDHCANVRITGNSLPEKWTAGIRALSTRRNVFMKVSGLMEGTGKPGQAPRALDFYRPVLDTIWDSFGEDRVFFGSNWPVSARYGDYPAVLALVQEYFRSKGPSASEKYFSKNAVRAYRLRR